jgi:hypothetical protein
MPGKRDVRVCRSRSAGLQLATFGGTLPIDCGVGDVRTFVNDLRKDEVEPKPIEI